MLLRVVSAESVPKMKLYFQRHRFFLWWTLIFFVAMRSLLNWRSSFAVSVPPETVTSAKDSVDQELYQHLVENARLCEFDDLARSYYPKNHPDTNKDDSETCWNLEWEYLQIPSTAILNRHELADHRLGNGKAGAAFRALIHLPHNNRINSACYAVLKSDLCRDKRKRTWWSFWRWDDDDSVVPCVADNAYFSFYNSYSCLKGEITGMLLHYSYHRRNLTLPPGLMPTWAVVVQPTWLEKAWWWPQFMPGRIAFGYPAHDPSVLGVIMPLRKFAGVYDMRDELPHEPSQVARTMLTAAQGLEAMHSLGLLHQDVHYLNVALYRDDSHQSLLYDYGVMAAGLMECTSPEMCDYCISPHIGQHRWGHRQVEGLSFAESDVYRFAHVIVRHMVRDGAPALKESLLECRTASQLVELLEDWSKKSLEE